MRLGAILTCLVLVACGPWPDVGSEASARNKSWPQLLPLSQIIGGGRVAVAEAEDAERLAVRAAALRRRANILRSSARDLDEMEALRARLP